MPIFSYSFPVNQEHDLQKNPLILVNLSFFILTIRLNFLMSKILLNLSILASIFQKLYYKAPEKCISSLSKKIERRKKHVVLKKKLWYPEVSINSFSY